MERPILLLIHQARFGVPSLLAITINDRETAGINATIETAARKIATTAEKTTTTADEGSVTRQHLLPGHHLIRDSNLPSLVSMLRTRMPSLCLKLEPPQKPRRRRRTRTSAQMMTLPGTWRRRSLSPRSDRPIQWESHLLQNGMTTQRSRQHIMPSASSLSSTIQIIPMPSLPQFGTLGTGISSKKIPSSGSDVVWSRSSFRVRTTSISPSKALERSVPTGTRSEKSCRHHLTLLSMIRSKPAVLSTPEHRNAKATCLRIRTANVAIRIQTTTGETQNVRGLLLDVNVVHHDMSAVRLHEMLMCRATCGHQSPQRLVSTRRSDHSLEMDTLAPQAVIACNNMARAIATTRGTRVLTRSRSRGLCGIRVSGTISLRRLRSGPAIVRQVTIVPWVESEGTM